MLSKDDQAAIEWLRDTTVERREFTLPELASSAAPLSPMKKVLEGQRPLTTGKFLAAMRVAFRRDANRCAAALTRFLRLITPRAIFALAPEPGFTGAVSREVDEAAVAALEVKRWQMRAEADGLVTPEERAEGRNLCMEAARQIAEAEAAIDAAPSAQLSLSVGAA